MGKIRKIDLSEQGRAELESGFRIGKSHAFRQRCQLILLKSEGRSGEEVAGILKIHPVVVGNWLKRYEREGIAGLHTKPGRGRKPVLDKQQDIALVRQAVEQERQRLGQAKLLVEEQLQKEFSLKTLKRFLKSITAATKE